MAIINVVPMSAESIRERHSSPPRDVFLVEEDVQLAAGHDLKLVRD